MLRAPILLALASPHAPPVQPPPQAQADTLRFTGYVVDQARILSPAVRQRLTEQLGRFERATRHQFAVVTVTTLNGADVATFATRLGTRWGVGRRGANDGVLLLVAPNEHKARIAVGDGLRAILPDRFCQAVMSQRMVPAFARGRYDEGVEAGVQTLFGRFTAAQSNNGAASPASRN